MITAEQRAQLAAPFANVQWRIAKKKKDNEHRGEAVCYIDARDVMDRLDDVFGDDGWSFDWSPISMGKDQDGEYVRTAKGTISVMGVTRSDIGEAGNYEKSKGAVSDSLKRAAVHFGIARYLYEMPSQWVDLDDYGNITAASQKTLNATLANLVRRTFGDVPTVASDPVEPLRAILRQWYPSAAAKIDAMTLEEAQALVLKASPFVKSKAA
jgi:hypothetical protein